MSTCVDAHEFHNQIAGNIRGFREKRGLTLTGLAELTGIGKSTLSNLERGSGNPTIETLWRLAQVLGVGYGELVGSAAPQASSSEGIYVELMNHEESERRIETFLMKFESHALREAEAHVQGVTENVLVLSGSLTVGRHNDQLVLNAGQSGTFGGDADHLYKAGPSGAQAIVSVIYPDLLADAYDPYSFRLEWPNSPEAWAGAQQLVNRACLEAKHGIPFARIKFTGCSLPPERAFEEMRLQLGPDFIQMPGMSMAFCGESMPEIIVFSGNGVNERIPVQAYPDQLSQAVALSNRAAHRTQRIDSANFNDLKDMVGQSLIWRSALSAEILTNAGLPTAPHHIGIKTVSNHEERSVDRAVASFEDRIDVDGYAAFELVHPAYARQCVEVASHLHRVNAREEGRILDVGSGPGLPLAIINELLPDMDFLAIDPSETAHAYLEARFANNPRISTLKAGIDSLPAGMKFKHVISTGASHHLDTTIFLSGIRDCMEAGGTLLVSDEMISPFTTRFERRQNLIAHHLRYIVDTLVPVSVEDGLFKTEKELVKQLKGKIPSILFNALAGEVNLADERARKLLALLHDLELPGKPSTPELAFYRFHILELEALVAGLDYEIEQKTYPSCFLDLARDTGFDLLDHRRIYATHGRRSWDAGTHVFALEAI